MAAFDTLIRGGKVVSAEGTQVADVGVRGGKIAAIGEKLGEARETIDATGRLVLPGGIDSHVHLAQPSGPGIVMADDFESGTRAAAFGGNTLVMPFCIQERGRSLREALTEYHAKADGKCYIDTSFHLVISDPSQSVLGQELPAVVADGYTSFKIFMTYEALKLADYQILEVLAVARETGALVMVHAENDDAIRFLTERLERAGRTEAYYHTVSRPVPVEREATHRAISLAELLDVPIMIVHVSNGDAIEEIARAQARGLKIYGETCPQYLVLKASDLRGLDLEAAKLVCSPPPRDAKAQAECWDGLRRGVFSVFSSDHCPFRYQDERGKLAPKGRESFRYVPNGIPGIETRLPILFSEGVVKGRISLEQFVALTSTNHARMYGLYPQKGEIAIDADADITIWDAERRVQISQSLLHGACDYTPYEGIEVTGWPVLTMVRGRVVVRDGELVGDRGFGRHLPRERPASAMPAGRLVTDFDPAPRRV
jgi:dihydropyrimidinase